MFAECRLVYTLVFIKKNNQLLLGLKKRGFGKGKWNGFGGKVEKHETVFEGAIRETKEECNLNLQDIKYIGLVAYEEQCSSTVDIVHIFTSSKFSDTLMESEEMKPQWYDIKEIPFEKMWPDAKIWYPYMLAEKYFLAHVIYEEEEHFKNCIIKDFASIDTVLDAVKTIVKEF